MASSRKTQRNEGKDGFFKRHWKKIVFLGTVVITAGISIFLIIKSQGDDTASVNLPLPDSDDTLSPELQFDIPTSFDEEFDVELPDDTSSSAPRSYVWKEEGHEVVGHIRHYKDGTETYIHPYYKPTGSNSDEAA